MCIIFDFFINNSSRHRKRRFKAEAIRFGLGLNWLFAGLVTSMLSRKTTVLINGRPI